MSDAPAAVKDLCREFLGLEAIEYFKKKYSESASPRPSPWLPSPWNDKTPVWRNRVPQLRVETTPVNYGIIGQPIGASIPLPDSPELGPTDGEQRVPSPDPSLVTNDTTGAIFSVSSAASTPQTNASLGPAPAPAAAPRPRPHRYSDEWYEEMVRTHAGKGQVAERTMNALLKTKDETQRAYWSANRPSTPLVPAAQEEDVAAQTGSISPLGLGAPAMTLPQHAVHAAPFVPAAAAAAAITVAEAAVAVAAPAGPVVVAGASTAPAPAGPSCPIFTGNRRRPGIELTPSEQMAFEQRKYNQREAAANARRFRGSR